MHADVAQQLIDLNRRFYQSFAQPFSDTRGRLQSGVLRAIEDIPKDASILDLGCGNGELAGELEKRGYRGGYLGLDFSEDLLKIARHKLKGSLSAEFAQADLATPDFNQHSTLNNQTFDFVFAFATLHHIPSRALHLQMLEQVRSLLWTKATTCSIGDAKAADCDTSITST
jgi:SAM-dependent methyltransferase